MNKKFYVSLEAARLLKKKGYNDGVEMFYNDIGFLREVREFFEGWECLSNDRLYNNCFSAPSKAEAIDWLESKGIVVQTIPSTPNIWRWRMSSMKYIPYDDNTEDSEILYSTRLEAEDGAIIIACKLLENGN